MVFEEMRRAVEGAQPHRLPEVATAIWQAYGAGGLSDEQAEQLDALMRARQGAAEATPAPGPDRAGAEPAAPACARKRGVSRVGSRPRSRESKTRSRTWAAAGYLPPKLAACFTQSEQAVLAVIASEVGKRGTCTLAHAHVAALAGVSVATSKRAQRQAKTLGLISIEERRVGRRRNDTNVVRIVGAEWRAWLRLRLPRSTFAAPGDQTGTGTNIKANRAAFVARERPVGRRKPDPAPQLALTGSA